MGVRKTNQNLEYLYRINHKNDRPYLDRVMEKVGLDAPDYLILDELFHIILFSLCGNFS